MHVSCGARAAPSLERFTSTFGATNMGNVTLRFALAVLVGAFYSFYVYKALRTGRARRYFGGWVTSNEAPYSFYSTIAISAGLAFFALYVAFRTGTILITR